MNAVKTVWSVKGMFCPHCESTIGKVMQALPGIQEAKADYKRGTLTALWNAEKLPEARIREALAEEGYTLCDKRKRARSVLRIPLFALGIAGLCALMLWTPLARWMNAFPMAQAGMGLGALFLVGVMTSVHCVAVMGVSMLASGLALTGVHVALPSRGPANVAIVAGNGQTVWSELDYGSYPAITVQAGLPVTWTFHAEEEKLNGCNNALVILEYGLNVTFQPGDNVITFTPEEEGVIPYSCWMGMIRSSINVVDVMDE